MWLPRILSAAWAGFWLWFGVAWAVHERLPWHAIALSTLRPGLPFVAVALAGWLWPRVGSVLLILTGFFLAGWYAIYFGHMPVATKLFVLATFALPPLACGVMLLWRAPASNS